MTEPNDTSPEAALMQIELFRRATESQRLSLALALSDTMLQLSERAIREANPDLDEDAMKVKIVATWYGAELAEKLRRYLAERRR